jgi:regulator of protease activity HflC (stomatin/prohibitin superfamily)
MTLSDMPPSDPTTRSQTVALVIGLVQAIIGLLLWSLTQNYSGERGVAGFHIPLAMADLAASLFVAAAGLIAAGIVAHRGATGSDEPADLAESSAPPPTDTDAEAQHLRRSMSMPRWLKKPDALASWPQIFVTLLLAALALAALMGAWRLEAQAPMTPRAEQVFGGLAILLAFPYVVLERFYANMPPHVLPDASRVERLLRVPLASLLAIGIANLLLSVGFAWPLYAEKAVAILIGLIAIELVLRCLVIAFVPFDGSRSLADSGIASFLRLTPPSVQSVSGAMKRQFGIDLSRSWALAFVRSAALPITLGMIIFAWCLSGVTALGLNERAVYERFGVPVAVMGPGLHIHWPWPFGIARPVELGVVHEIPIVFSAPGTPSDALAAPGETPAAADTIEGPAPASADRLWNESHPSEASYLVASEAQGQQSFQIVNVDLRIVYRIGLTDAAAEQAAYAIDDPEALLRALAGRLLARYFARYTLLDVLGQSRERFTNDFRTALQSDLAALPTGIEIIAVVVEAIHPPPAAAGAYHAVQAAEINAQSQISLQRANAIAKTKSAEQTATQGLDDATARAAELVEQAQAQSVLFEADRQAYAQDGQVFLLERWFERLSNTLPRSSFIIIDHRLKGVAAPTIDFRSFGMPGVTYQYTPQTPSTRSPPPPPPPPSSSGGDQESEGD